MSESDNDNKLVSGLALLALLITTFGSGLYYGGLLKLTEKVQKPSENVTNTVQKQSNLSPSRDNSLLSTVRLSSVVSNKEFYNREDLKAQRAMAHWTEVMGKAALVGMIVGIIGIFLLWKTWAETRKAAKSAQANSESYIWNERARLLTLTEKISTFGNYKEGHSPIPMKLENIGKSIAIIDEVRFTLSDNPTYKPSKQSVQIRRSLVEPKDKEIFDELITNDIGCIDKDFIVGEIIYKSMGEMRFSTYFCYKITYILDETDHREIVEMELSECKNLPKNT